MARKDGGCLGGELLVRLKTEESERVSGRTVERGQAVVVVVLAPHTVRAAACPEGGRRHARRVEPPLFSCPLVHRKRGEKRARRAPTDVVGRVVDVAEDEPVEVVRERRVAREPKGDEQRRPSPRRAATPECGARPRARARRDVFELEGAQSSRREIESRLRVAVAAQRVERPDDTRGAGVESVQPLAVAVLVPDVGRPERVGVEFGVGVRHDRGDRVTGAALVPRLVRQRLEVLRVVEHRLRSELVPGAFERVGGTAEVGRTHEHVVRLEG